MHKLININLRIN